MRNRDYQLYICFFTWLVDLVISASRRDITTTTAKSISPTVLGNPNFVVDDRVERVLEGGKAFKVRRNYLSFHLCDFWTYFLQKTDT